MPKPNGMNSKALEAMLRKKEQREAIRLKEEAERLDKFWADDDKLVKAKQERKAETLRKQQERLQRKAELKDLLSKEESQITSNKQGHKSDVPKKPTRAEILRMQLLQAELAKKEAEKAKDSYSFDDLLQPNINQENKREQLELEQQNIDLVRATGLDDILDTLCITDGKSDKRVRAAFIAYQERKLQELKLEYPNLKLSQYKDMIYKSWKKSPENPLARGNNL